jgi:hypothetical protein
MIFIYNRNVNNTYEGRFNLMDELNNQNNFNNGVEDPNNPYGMNSSMPGVMPGMDQQYTNPDMMNSQPMMDPNQMYQDPNMMAQPAMDHTQM